MTLDQIVADMLSGAMTRDAGVRALREMCRQELRDEVAMRVLPAVIGRDPVSFGLADPAAHVNRAFEYADAFMKRRER